MRVGVFRLAYKTKKETDDPDEIICSYKLVYKDNLGNQITLKGSEDDYEGTEPGAILDLKDIIRQTTLPER